MPNWTRRQLTKAALTVISLSLMLFETTPKLASAQEGSGGGCGGDGGGGGGGGDRGGRGGDGGDGGINCYYGIMTNNPGCLLD